MLLLLLVIRCGLTEISTRSQTGFVTPLAVIGPDNNRSYHNLWCAWMTPYDYSKLPNRKLISVIFLVNDLVPGESSLMLNFGQWSLLDYIVFFWLLSNHCLKSSDLFKFRRCWMLSGLGTRDWINKINYLYICIVYFGAPFKQFSLSLPEVKKKKEVAETTPLIPIIK